MGEHFMAFVRKLNDDGVEMDLGVERFTALQCRFGGYLSSENVQKTCIWADDTYSWLEQCYGLKWVAVHGLKAICVVISRDDVDMSLVGPFYRGTSEEIVMLCLTTALLSETRGLADDVFLKSSGHLIVKPFGVVSVDHSRAERVQEGSSADYDEKKAIDFLKEKMKCCCSEYTYEKTIQTAISVFQHLCIEDLKAEDIFVCVIEDIGVASYNLTIRETEEHLALYRRLHKKHQGFTKLSTRTRSHISFIGKQATEMNLAMENSGENPDDQRSGEGGREKKADEYGYSIISYEDMTHYGPDGSFETASEISRKNREFGAYRFWRACTTMDSVDKTFIGSDGTYSWTDNSYGMMWVAVHGTDNSICVVNRLHDMDMTRIDLIKLALPRKQEMYALTEAIMSEIEGLPYDGEFSKRSGQSIKKPFGVVSVVPFTEKSHEVSGQLDHDKNKAINFLMDKMKIESAITFDETVKTAISAFQYLCLQKLKAEDFWVTAWRGTSLIDHLLVNEIKEHLDAINGVHVDRKCPHDISL